MTGIWQSVHNMPHGVFRLNRIVQSRSPPSFSACTSVRVSYLLVVRVGGSDDQLSYQSTAGGVPRDDVTAAAGPVWWRRSQSVSSHQSLRRGRCSVYSVTRIVGESECPCMNTPCGPPGFGPRCRKSCWTSWSVFAPGVKGIRIKRYLAFLN